MPQTDADTIRRGAAVFMFGAAATAVSGLLIQTVVQPSTDVSDKMWRYPWSDSGTFIAVSLLYIVFHLLVVVGLAAFGRSGAAGTSRTGRVGIRLAVVGTMLLAAGEVASLPIRDASVHDTSAAVVGAAFGLGVLVSAIGLLTTGSATLSARRWEDWRRFTPLAAGLWTTVLLGINMTKALPSGVAIYGLCLLAMAIALYSDPLPGAASDSSSGGVPDFEARLQSP